MSRTVHLSARVAIERSDENLFAHVDVDYPIGPGDRVQLGGPPIRMRFGERAELVRPATVRPASSLRRLWTRIAGHFALTELYEISFSGRSLP